MRVITGKAKGRRLLSVPGASTRPITDRTKESLFNIISQDILSASMLDLFAGTGSVGIEALSRGAAFVRFIDINQNAILTIKKNLDLTGFLTAAQVIKGNSLTYLEREADFSFDYIYIAPPQYKELWIKTLIQLDNHSAWLSKNAWIIVQIHPVEFQNTDYNTFYQFDVRVYGSTQLLFFQRK